MRKIALIGAAVLLAAGAVPAYAQMYDPNNPARLVDPNAARGMLGQDQQRQESLRSLQNSQDRNLGGALDRSQRSTTDHLRQEDEIRSGDRLTRPPDADAINRAQQRSQDAIQQERNARDAYERRSPPKLPGE